ncbi:MAG: hypothetical protein A2176_02520 [Spirochaetes bacterium RBG_13_51_14]|nr:MAG: hypothetical protein A2176_02520 [Spirochaetes bacterium RBG_13_51_14]
MISIDFECSNEHRFEGCFNDYDAYKDQLGRGLIACPLCNSRDVRRLYTGCSIQAKSSDTSRMDKKYPTMFDFIRSFNQFVREHFENVGGDFVNAARAIHYGLEEERCIYGESSPDEIQELHEEGIDIIPLIDLDNVEH